MSTLPISQPNVRIVYVDDYQLIRHGIATYLNSVEGMLVAAEADSAEDGLMMIDKHRPDLVLMDLGLPRMNGIEATKIAKRTYPDLKVIILTSHEDEESVIAALGAGANAYCLKDMTTERLVDVIRLVMEGAAWLDPTIATIALSVFTKASETNAQLASQQGAGETISLGERELEVLRLLTHGLNNQQIADKLYVSVHTVKSQVSTILQKLSVNDRVQAAVKAVTTGMVSVTSDMLTQTPVL